MAARWGSATTACRPSRPIAPPSLLSANRSRIQPHPHPTLSLSEGEGFFLIPRPRRGRGPQFELKNEVLRRGLSKTGGDGSQQLVLRIVRANVVFSAARTDRRGRLGA